MESTVEEVIACFNQLMQRVYGVLPSGHQRDDLIRSFLCGISVGATYQGDITELLAFCTQSAETIDPRFNEDAKDVYINIEIRGKGEVVVLYAGEMKAPHLGKMFECKGGDIVGGVDAIMKWIVTQGVDLNEARGAISQQILKIMRKRITQRN